MIELLQRVVAWLMNRVRLNRIQQGIHDGVPMIVKRRRPGASIVIWFANRFLVLAGGGICMFVRADEWMDWEDHCAELLYPDRPDVKIGPGQSVTIPEVRGMSLRQLMHGNETNVNALVAAAREVRRVHRLECGYFEAAWSHGDLHLDNVLYDSDANRAVLVDFDTRHESRINQTGRHSDDLKVFLLELFALPDNKWCQRATVFIEEYREASVLNELSRQLFVPLGFAKILWYTRTNCSPTRDIEQRIQILKETILQVAAKAGRSAGTK